MQYSDSFQPGCCGSPGSGCSCRGKASKTASPSWLPAPNRPFGSQWPA